MLSQRSSLVGPAAHCAAQCATVAALAVLVGTAVPGEAARADINPLTRDSYYNPKKWDTEGPGTALPWLHPPIWTQDQDWGVLGGDPEAQNLTGGWGGLRDRLVAWGLSLQSAYLGQFAANPVGGVTQGGASWRGDLALAAYADLDRLFGLDRTYFAASMAYDDGTRSLTPAYVGNQFPVQLSTVSVDRLVRLVHLTAGTQIFDDTLELDFGRLITGDAFATLSQACNSLNQAICANPIAAVQDVSFPIYPNAVWGMGLQLRPERSWYALGGAFLVDDEIFDPTNGGVDFGAPPGSGPLVIGEVGYLAGLQDYRPGAATPDAFAVSGTYKLGAYYDGESLENLSTGAQQRHTWGLYAMGEHRLYREARDRDDGLWGWLAASYAPPDVNEVQFMIAGGLSYNGLLDSRPNDTLSFTFARGQYSGRLEDRNAETLLEVGYKAQLLPWTYVEPNVQYVIDPDGKSTIDDALVVGFALGVTF